MNKENKLAPIVLFVYNRLNHTKITLEALQKNQLANESNLFIYSDSAKTDNDKPAVKQVREFIKTIVGFKDITIIERDKNLGLAESVIDGVTKVVCEFGKVIVLEDDLVTSPKFLKFMNEALDFYQEEDNVYSITGYSHTDRDICLSDSYFLNLTSSWSWATWSNKWKQLSRDKKQLQKIINATNEERKLFNFDNSYDFINMARLQIADDINSWAIYWYLTVFKHNGLTLYPRERLVKNIGFDGSGTHCSAVEQRDVLTEFYPRFTEDIYEDKKARNVVSSILRKKNNPNKTKNMLNYFKQKLPKRIRQFLSIVLAKIKLVFYKKDIGKNTFIDKTVNVFGWKYIQIGSFTLVGEQTWLNVNRRIDDFKHIEIGNYCYLGRRNLLSSSRRLIISDYVMTSNDCKFLGSNHIYTNPLKPYISTGTMNDDVLKIGVNVWIGANAIVLGSVDIGHGSIIGAGSVVTENIPPFSIAVGNPCKVIKRYNFRTNQWDKLGDFDKDQENLMPSEDDYLEILKSNNSDITMPIMAATSKYGDM